MTFRDTRFTVTLLSEDVKSYYTTRVLELQNISVGPTGEGCFGGGGVSAETSKKKKETSRSASERRLLRIAGAPKNESETLISISSFSLFCPRRRGRRGRSTTFITPPGPTSGSPSPRRLSSTSSSKCRSRGGWGRTTAPPSCTAVPGSDAQGRSRWSTRAWSW